MTTKKFADGEPRCEIVTATKDLVDDLLRRNVSNRSVRKSHLQYLKREIAEGRMVLTNQGLGVDVDGNLIDGQHRLLALQELDYPPVQILVVYDLPREARSVVDVGVKRNMSDILHFAFNRPDVMVGMVAVCRAWLMFVHKKHRDPGYKMSPSEAHETFDILSPALTNLYLIPGCRSLPAPVLAAICHALVLRPDDTRPLMFAQKLVSGAELGEGSPILLLRNWLAKAKGTLGGKPIASERFDQTATALTHYLQGKDRSILRKRADALAWLTSAVKNTYTAATGEPTNG